MSFYSNSSYSPFKVNSNVLTNGTPPSFQNLNSFEFDGVDDRLFSTSNYTEINGTQNFSISFWIKPTDTTNAVIWKIGKQSGNQRLACIWRTNGSVDISFNTSSYYYRTLSNSVPFNQWSHIVYTFDGTQSRYQRPRVYINGVIVNGTSTGVIVTSSDFNGVLELGGVPSGFGASFIDEFSVWNNTTLTESQANELYNNGAPTDLNNIASGLTSPTTWFRMGDSAIWNGFTWTMTDVNGGLVTRGANMVEANRTTDVPT
jgi:hypothetical protein